MNRRTKRMALVGVILLGAFMLFMSVGGFAASSSQGVTVSATVSKSIQLTMNPSPLLLGTQPPGGPYPGTIAATVNSNATWSMGVVKSGDLNDGAGNIIPSADLTYTSSTSDGRVKNLQGTAIEFGSSSTNVCNGSDRGSGETLIVNYSLTVPWDIPPGTYTATHTYTVTNG